MYLGLDIGTSAVKAVLADDAFAPRAQATVPLTLDSPAPYWSEQHPDDWWRATLTACVRLAASAPGLWRRVEAIGLSGQMHGAVLLDAGRRVIRPAILWNDGRAHAEAAVLAARAPETGLIAGVCPHPGFTAPKLMWMAAHEPGAFARIAHVLLPKDYIGLMLHGGLGTDMSDAAGTLWFDQAARAWSAVLIDASGAQARWLPRCREATDVAGGLTAAAAAALDLPAGLPVAAGGGDTAVGAVGVGLLHPGAASLSMGTSGQLATADDAYRPDPRAFVHAFAHAAPGLWYRMAAVVNGARPLAWFAGIAGAPIGTLLAEAAAAAPGRTPLFLPYLSGERTPLADPHIRGAFMGLEDGTTRGQMMRAVVEAVAYSFAEAADALWPAGAPRPAVLPAIGGGLRGDLMTQTLADVLGIAIDRASGATSGPALGAAKIAAWSIGATNAARLSHPPRTERRFAPDPAQGARHQDRRARFRALYGALAPLSR